MSEIIKAIKQLHNRDIVVGNWDKCSVAHALRHMRFYQPYNWVSNKEALSSLYFLFDIDPEEITETPLVNVITEIAKVADVNVGECYSIADESFKLSTINEFKRMVGFCKRQGMTSMQTLNWIEHNCILPAVLQDNADLTKRIGNTAYRTKVTTVANKTTRLMDKPFGFVPEEINDYGELIECLKRKC